VKFGREYVYRSEVGERNPDLRALIPQNQEEVINSEVQILTSQDLIERVIKDIKIENLYPDVVKSPPRRGTPLDAAIHQFEKDLSVEGIRKSSVIQVAFKHKDPAIAAKTVNLLTEFLKEKHLQVYSDPKSSFLEHQLQAFDQRLRESQQRLEDFKQKHRVFSLEEQRTFLLRQRTELDTAFKFTENQVREMQKKIASLKEQMRDLPEDTFLQTEVDRYKITDDAKANLLALRLKEQQLLEKYREDNRLVVNIRKEIRIVQDFIKTQEDDVKGKVRTGKNIVYQDIEKDLIKGQADLASLEAKRMALRGQLSQIDLETQNLDLRENELENLKREMISNEKNYKTYLEKVEEARISEDLNRQKMANISVVQVAAIPAKPVKPKKLLNIVLGIILGAVAGLGLAFFSEYTDQGLSTPERAERRLGLPVLATVPYKK
jgi:uncharacterized protein involved in exopolysaccharide biosynthesis